MESVTITLNVTGLSIEKAKELTMHEILELIQNSPSVDAEHKVSSGLCYIDGKFKWAFNWIGGGFNDVWAADYYSARKEIYKQFGDDLEVDLKTLKRATAAEDAERGRIANMFTD